MARSVWKGPFVHPSLIKKVTKQSKDGSKRPIKTWSRNSTIIPEFVGHKFEIHNGKKFIPISVSEEMVGHKLGEFAPTRQFAGHTPARKKPLQQPQVLHQLHLHLRQPELKMTKNKDLSLVKATYKNLRSSPRKVNNILRSIRGLKAEIALRNLRFFREKSCK